MQWKKQLHHSVCLLRVLGHFSGFPRIKSRPYRSNDNCISGVFLCISSSVSTLAVLKYIIFSFLTDHWALLARGFGSTPVKSGENSSFFFLKNEA